MWRAARRKGRERCFDPDQFVVSKYPLPSLAAMKELLGSKVTYRTYAQWKEVNVLPVMTTARGGGYYLPYRTLPGHARTAINGTYGAAEMGLPARRRRTAEGRGPIRIANHATSTILVVSAVAWPLHASSPTSTTSSPGSVTPTSAHAASREASGSAAAASSTTGCSAR